MYQFRCASATLVALLSTVLYNWNATLVGAKTLLPPVVDHSVSEVSASASTIPELVASRLNRYGLRFRVQASPYRRGGFSRGASCPEGQEITAITPAVSPDGDRLDDTAPTYLTASSHPTFFIHVPQLPATRGILTIQSQDPQITDRFSYNAEFALNGQTGIVGIRLPEDAPPLELGVEYVWRVSVACTPNSITDSLTTHGGVVKRIAVDTDASATSLDAYLEAGVWQEALTILAEERYSNPPSSNGDSESDWSLLMNAAGLADFANAPIVQMIDANERPSQFSAEE